jgi:inosine-uridine nucleoside N-ribohydrolase
MFQTETIRTQMTHWILVVLVFACALRAQPIPVIFDTDMGNDVDDLLALAMLHSFQNRGQVELLAVTITKDHRNVAPFIEAVNRFYGRPSIPIGMVRNGVTREPSAFVDGLVNLNDSAGRPAFPRSIQSGNDVPEATAVLRSALQRSPDGKVVIIQVGFSTNLARLLDLPADQELVRRKVRRLVLMAGMFTQDWAEYNVKEDIPSAQRLVREWPTPMVFSGFEIGRDMKYPAASILADYSYVKYHPVAVGYGLYMKMPYDRETWDLTAVLHAVRPSDGYFSESQPGRVQIDERGVSRFEFEENGPHRILYTQGAQRERALEAMVWLASEPPKSLSGMSASGAIRPRLVEVP